MSLFESLIAKLAPHDCLSCGAEGALLCYECLKALPWSSACCYRCHQPSKYGLTCADCRRQTQLSAVRPATVYAGVAKQLIWRLKSSGAQAAAEVMARRMKFLFRQSFQGVEKLNRPILVAVPTATTRIRQRGYDQSKLLARRLARKVGLPWVDCLARSGQTHQVGAGREQRLEQLGTALRVSQRRFVRGAHIILVDDVVTTGATLEAAAAVLKAAGAAHIEAIVFARPTFRQLEKP